MYFLNQNPKIYATLAEVVAAAGLIDPPRRIRCIAGLHNGDSITSGLSDLEFYCLEGLAVFNTASQGKGTFNSTATAMRWTLTKLRGENIAGDSACGFIRYEGIDLTTNDVQTFKCPAGILTGNKKWGSVVRLNRPWARECGIDDHAHPIYIGECALAVITDADLFDNPGGGHLLKSRAAMNIVVRGVYDEQNASRAMDWCYGGRWALLGKGKIIQGNKTQNSDIINMGAEADPRNLLSTLPRKLPTNPDYYKTEAPDELANAYFIDPEFEIIDNRSPVGVRVHVYTSPPPSVLISLPAWAAKEMAPVVVPPVEPPVVVPPVPPSGMSITVAVPGTYDLVLRPVVVPPVEPPAPDVDFLWSDWSEFVFKSQTEEPGFIVRIEERQRVVIREASGNGKPKEGEATEQRETRIPVAPEAAEYPSWGPKRGEIKPISKNTLSSVYVKSALGGGPGGLTAWCGSIYIPTVGELGSQFFGGEGHTDGNANGWYLIDCKTQLASCFRKPYDKPVKGPGGFPTDLVYGEAFATAAGELVVPPEPSMPHTRASLFHIPPADWGNERGILGIGMSQLNYVANPSKQIHGLNLDNGEYVRLGALMPVAAGNNSACYDRRRGRAVTSTYSGASGGIHYSSDQVWVLQVRGVAPDKQKWATVPGSSPIQYNALAMHYSEEHDFIVVVTGYNTFSLYDAGTLKKIMDITEKGTPPAGVGGSELVDGRGVYYYAGNGAPDVHLLQYPANPRTTVEWEWLKQTLVCAPEALDAAGQPAIPKQASSGNPHFHRFVRWPEPFSDATSDFFGWLGSAGQPLYGFRTVT